MPPKVITVAAGVTLSHSLFLRAESMTPSEIARVEAYLRATFGNPRIRIEPPKKQGAPIEVSIGDEFIGVLYRDEEDGEVSYSLNISILEEDLPAPGKGK
jgi:hypothetical protein